MAVVEGAAFPSLFALNGDGCANRAPASLAHRQWMFDIVTERQYCCGTRRLWVQLETGTLFLFTILRSEWSLDATGDLSANVSLLQDVLEEHLLNSLRALLSFDLNSNQLAGSLRVF